MEQEHKDITAPQIYETSIGLVGMSKTEYAMYQEEMEKRVGNLHIYVDADACTVVGIVERIAEKYGIPGLCYVIRTMCFNQITVR